jgi:uncharacterized protein (TIGR00369 family)
VSRLNPDYIEQVIQLTNNAPFPSHLPFTLEVIDFDYARVRVDIEPKHMQPYGIVHGGVIATLIDTATFWSAFAAIPEDAGMVNVDLKLNYLKALKEGCLIAEGRCLRRGRTISYSETHIRSDQGDLIAHGTSSLMTLPGQGFKLDMPKFLDESFAG